MEDRDEVNGLGASAQGDGDAGGETKPAGEATEVAEAPATTGDPGDEDVAHTN